MRIITEAVRDTDIILLQVGREGRNPVLCCSLQIEILAE